MKNSMRYLFVLAPILVWQSCVSTEKTIVNKLTKYGPPYDAAWHKELDNARAQTKEAWLKYFDMNFFAGRTEVMGSILGITKSDLSKTTNVPVEFFMFPTSSFLAWKPVDPIEPKLTLLQDRMYSLIALDGVFFIWECANLIKDKWIFVAGGHFEAFRSKILSELYFKKKTPIIIICVKERKDGWMGNKTFFAFKENGVLKCVENDRVRLLSDSMFDYNKILLGL